MSPRPPLKRRYLCLWFTELATDRVMRAQPDLAGLPMVMITPDHGRPIISALNSDAVAAGAAYGQPLANARAIAGERANNIAALPHDIAKDHACLTAMGAWCIQFTPRVAVEGMDNLILDITGCAHLSGGEQAMADMIGDKFHHIGFSIRLAIADTVGLAWALAHFGDDRISLQKGSIRKTIAPLSVYALRLPAPVASSLCEFGLHTIEQINRLKRKQLASRFGLGLLKRLDQISGDATEPLSIIAEATRRLSQYRFLEPARWESAIRHATKNLLQDLCAQEVANGTGLRRVRLEGFCVDGEITGFSIGTHQPSRDPDHLYRLMNDKFSSLEAGFGIEVLQLIAEESAPFEAGEMSFQGQARTKADPDLSALMDNLAMRLGKGCVKQMAPHQSWIPERAETRRPFPEKTISPEWPRQAPRPVQLFTPPEPLYDADLELHRFTWRRQTYQVMTRDGPERIVSEWWKGEDGIRDYYTIEVTTGARLWVFLRSDMDPPRWYAHGVLA